MSEASAPSWLHAVAVTLGECGILIRGSAGSGKTSLGLALIDAAMQRGWFARLVGDDRVGVQVAHGRLLARPHPRVAGLVERRGIGVVPTPFEPACLLRLAVHLVRDIDGLPERSPSVEPAFTLGGVDLPELLLLAGRGACENAGRVLEFMNWRQMVR